MIHPNMGTMLAYVFIEANLSKGILQKLLKIILKIHLIHFNRW